MPDLSQFSPEKPFTPSVFSKVNINDVFIGAPGLPEVSTPTKPNGVGGGNDLWSLMLRTTGKNPFAHMGPVTAAPGAVDDYYSNRKFTSEADTYQFGSLYKDLGFLIGRDNEDLYGTTGQGKPAGFANTAIRLLDKAGAYTLQGFGFLGGLVGLGNKNQNYNSGSGVADWIAGASDNALSVWSKDVADDVDNIYRPVYQEAADRDKGFFKRMLTDGDFWTNEAVDMTAFLASAYATGNVTKFLDLGSKAVRGVAALRGLNYAERGVALAEEGLTGASETMSLSGGAATTAGAVEQGAPLVPNAMNSGNIFKRVFQEAGNFANANKINMAVGTVINSASESMVEASSLKDSVIESLAAKKNADGTDRYSVDEIKSKGAIAARNSFALNMIALPISNLWEMKLFFGKASPLSARNSLNPLVRREAGLLADAEVVKRTFGEKGMDWLKHSGEGILKEGLWEENIQLAIQRVNEDPENLDLGAFKNIGRVLNQYASQTGAALSGNDTEASTSIGLGGLLGGLMGVHGRVKDIKELKKDVTNYNASINAFKTSARDLYEKNDDGTIRLDHNNVPVLNTANILSYVSSLNKTLSMTELADNLKDKNMPILHSIVENENFVRLFKAYADHGLADDLLTKLDNLEKLNPSDALSLGLNPDKAQAGEKLQKVRDRFETYKSIYDDVQKNFFVRMRNDKNGDKAREMKDKLFFLSTRAGHLSTLIDEQKNVKERGLAIIGENRYQAITDDVVNSLNDFYTDYAAAKKRVDFLSFGNNQIAQAKLDASYNENIKVGENMIITRPRTYEQQQRELIPAVDQEELSDAVDQMNTAEKKLKDYVEENKDTIKGLRKGTDGKYRYEVEEKNRLAAPASKAENIEKDLTMARNATMNVFSRISDMQHGEEYYDNVYSKRKQDLQEVVSNDPLDTLDENLSDDPLPPTDDTNPDKDDGLNDSEENEAPIFQQPQDVQDTINEVNTLKAEKEGIQNQQEVSLEDEARIDAIDNKINTLEDALNTLDNSINDDIVSSSTNIKLEDKADYKEILNKIAENKRNVIKKDGYYEVNGERYRKVSDVVGNTIPEEIRPTIQNAITAGYTVDAIVKAYFDGTINSDDFKEQMVNKISEHALEKLKKSLDAVRNQIYKEGGQIVGTNVVVFDPQLKIAGEIDILAVDKDGNFKIYEVEARKSSTWGQIATRQGRGPAIYEITQKQLSAYRNLFANQYGVLPDTIAVKFPIQVQYDTKSQSGFIEKASLRPEIRYTPTSVIEIKSKIFQPVRIGSVYDGFDMTSLFTNTFIPASMDVAKEKLRFLFRNESFAKIKSGLVMNVREAEERFQEKYNSQRKFLSGEDVSGFKLTRLNPNLNLYALNGNKEISLSYDGQLLGMLAPSPTLAYKSPQGKFLVLDENTDLETYKTATGNSEQTFKEFKNISKAYKAAYSDLTKMAASNEGETTLPNKTVQEMFDISMSYGELDLIGKDQDRPYLNDLVVKGVKIGNKNVVTVVDIDPSDSFRVIMDKNTRTKNTGRKLQEIDGWVSKNIKQITSALTNKRGERVSNYAAIIETPDGKYHTVSLRLAKGATVGTNEDYIQSLGDKFTASVTKNVFKNESVSLIPKRNVVTSQIKLKGESIISEVYPTEDVESLEENGLNTSQVNSVAADTTVNSFVNSLSGEDFTKINNLFAAFEMSPEELTNEILDDFNSGNFSSIDSYIEEIKCKI